MPDVMRSHNRVHIRDKLVWTTLSILIFLVASQMPLYGIVSSSKSDPIYWMRPILASSKDSLMELGILPLITANMIIQLF